MLRSDSTTMSPAAIKPLISIVAPARNEEATLAAVLQPLVDLTDDLIVVDGRSTDATAAIAAAFGARVLQDHGRGKGDAVRVGLEASRSPITVFIDADGSHDPADIPRLVTPLLRNEADLVIGSRMRGGSDELFGSPAELFRLGGTLLIGLLINARFGVRQTDYQNGFRAIRTDVGRALKLTSDIATIEQEMAMKALQLGYRIAETPAHEYRRQGGVSKLSAWKSAPRFLWSLLRGLAVRRRPPVTLPPISAATAAPPSSAAPETSSEVERDSLPVDAAASV